MVIAAEITFYAVLAFMALVLVFTLVSEIHKRSGQQRYKHPAGHQHSR